MQESKIQLPTSSLLFLDCCVTIHHNPRLKHSYIRVERDKRISVKTPLRSEDAVVMILENKRNWIERQLQKSATQEHLDYKPAQELLLFAKRYSLESPEAAALKKELESLKDPSTTKIQKVYDNYYKTYAKAYLTPQVEAYAKKMNVSFNALKFRKMKSRWGSCSSHGNITLNTQLLMLKQELITYVIVHELAHRIHMNHSAAFHQLVESYLPGSKELRKELKRVSIVL